MRKVIVWNAMLVLVGLVVLELSFGSWLSSNPLRQLNLLQDVQYRFDVSRLYQSARNPIRYKRDRYGLRGVYGGLADIDVLTIGGSAVDQRYLGEGQTWQDILRQRFAVSGRIVRIANAGLDGQSLYGNIKNFEYWFPLLTNLRTKYVLAYVGVNDLFTYEKFHNDDLRGTETLKGVIKAKSALYHAYRTLVGTYLAMFYYPLGHHRVHFDEIAWTTKALQARHRVLMAPRLTVFEQHLRILNQKIRQMGAIPIYVTQTSRAYKVVDGVVLGTIQTWPYEGQDINGVDFYVMLRLMHQKMMDVCKDVNGICLDLERELAVNDRDFYDYFHNTPTGSAKIANYLYHKLASYF